MSTDDQIIARLELRHILRSNTHRPRYLRAIELRALGCTYAEIGLQLSVTGNRAREIIRNALKIADTRNRTWRDRYVLRTPTLMDRWFKRRIS
jgi:hypothetical protein